MDSGIASTGQKFGRLVALKALRKGREIMWRCLCDCGREKDIRRCDIVRGRVRSCGCLRREGLVARNKKNRRIKHGHTTVAFGGRTPEYQAFVSAKKRCDNPNDKGFSNYGAKNVKCLFTSFEHFFSVLGPKPSAEHSLGRILDMGNYEPENCFWQTRDEQALAQRNKYALLKWKNCGYAPKRLRSRGSKNGRAKLNTLQVKVIKQKLTEGVSPNALALEYGVSEPTICSIRVERTWKDVNKPAVPEA